MDEQRYEYHETIDSDRDSITHELVRVLACYKDRPVEDLPPMAHSTDPDALAKILDGEGDQSSQGGMKVEFDYGGIHMGVSSTGGVWIWEPSDSVA